MRDEVLGELEAGITAKVKELKAAQTKRKLLQSLIHSLLSEI